MIKTLVFDLGGVYFTDGTKRAIETISSRYQIPKEKVKEILQGELGYQYRIGAITAGQFWTRAKANWQVDTSSDELAKIWLEEYVPITETVEIIDRLVAAGYELIFLSDNVQERVDYLEQKYVFLEKFKAGVFSHIAKTIKPDSRIYKLALQHTTNAPAECVYIDDKPAFLVPASALGMKTITFENGPQLERELHALGLKF